MDEKLNLDGVGSITEKSFEVILDIVRGLELAAKVVEFGSGKSSVRLAMELSDASITSIESDRWFFNRSNALAKEFDVQANLKIMYAPLKFQVYGLSQILSYEEIGFADAHSIDCIIIDGPPFYTLRGREACLYQSYDKLRLGGVVILDDCQRNGEKAILKNWLQVFPESFSVEIKKVGNHLAVLRKQKSVEARWDNPVKRSDGLQVTNCYDKIKAALTQITDADWLDWLAARGQAIPGYLNLDLLHQLRDAYGISADQAVSGVKANGEIMSEARQGNRAEECIEYCLRLFQAANQL
jgi:predicted O-methyltransferase YrrM